ncbi:hypothetical protein [Roseovarius sp. SYSU LYC5161]|uniref:hypothetical protein n=1 Tax=Roseovarius halophilus (ex Wu et al. 2025) TaxID=3376060 RepID=UPI00399AEABF
MTDRNCEETDRRLAALETQNRLLLAQAEALRNALAERDDEITRLSARLLEQATAPPPARPGLLARLRPRRR